MNLLERFVLQQFQATLLQIEVLKVVRDKGRQEAKVELSLAPRLVKADSGDALPAYQVTARLSCNSAEKGGKDLVFKAFGDPVDIAEFTANHASLTRQLYPLLQQELRALMFRVGLEDIRLPFDLAAQVSSQESDTVQVSGSVH